jgi:uncharacterized protein YdeI (YjbR/CyaY-like superfamily)
MIRNFPTLYVKNRKEWRSWLLKNHNAKKEIWLIYYKKHTGRTRIPYDDAVEEALCFGWIDSLVKRIDDETFAQKFTPRKTNSKWSEANRQRIRKLLTEGKVRKAGLAKIDPSILRPGSPPAPPVSKFSDQTSAFIARLLKANPPAWENFKNLAHSYQKNYIRWITAAKRSETRDKRLKEAIRLLVRNQKLGLK